MSDPSMRFPARPMNPTAFQVIDTPEKAYAVGFLLADGCVREPTKRSRSRITLRILAKDIKACRMVQEIAGGNLRLIEGGYRVEWDVSSDAIAADLTALGVTVRKSLTASLRWDRIPTNLHGAVLAGLIDGDGHLRYKPKQRQAEISVLTASVALKVQLLRLFPFFKLVLVPPRKGRKRLLYNLMVESNRQLLTTLIQTVYDPLPFTILDRKQAVLEAIRGYLATQEDYERKMADVPLLKAAGHTIEDIAARLGTSQNAVQKRLNDAGIDSRQVVFTDADRDEMRRLHEQGRTVRQIHASFGKATEQAVRYQLQGMGCITKTAKVLPRHPNADEILRLHREGTPAYQIAAQLGMRSEYVCCILKREGIVLEGGSPKKLTREMVIWADGELANGRTLRSVAEELGVSGTLVKIRRRQLLAEAPEAKPQIQFR